MKPWRSGLVRVVVRGYVGGEGPTSKASLVLLSAVDFPHNALSKTYLLLPIYLSTHYLMLNMPLVMPASLDAVSPEQSPPESTAAASASSPSPTLHLQQLSVPLPLSPHTTLHIQITSLEKSTMVFLTTTDPASSSSLSALGSFVYSIPNVPFPCQFTDLSSSTKTFTDKACHSSD